MQPCQLCTKHLTTEVTRRNPPVPRFSGPCMHKHAGVNAGAPCSAAVTAGRAHSARGHRTRLRRAKQRKQQHQQHPRGHQLARWHGGVGQAAGGQGAGALAALDDGPQVGTAAARCGTAAQRGRALHEGCAVPAGKRASAAAGQGRLGRDTGSRISTEQGHRNAGLARG